MQRFHIVGGKRRAFRSSEHHGVVAASLDGVHCEIKSFDWPLDILNIVSGISFEATLTKEGPGKYLAKRDLRVVDGAQYTIHTMVLKEKLSSPSSPASPTWPANTSCNSLASWRASRRNVSPSGAS